MPLWVVVVASLALLRAAALSAADGDADVKNTVSNETATKLIEAVRRQLVADNYDYLPSDSGEGLPPAPPAPAAPRRARLDDVTDDYDSSRDRHDYSYREGTDTRRRTKSTETLTLENEPNLRANEEFKQVEVNLKEIDDYAPKTNATTPNDHGIKKNDLYYYFDDQRLTHIDEELDPGVDPPQSVDPPQGVDPAQGVDPPQDVDPPQGMDATRGETSPNATYKVLTLKSKNRRSNQVRRFIKEESSAGVAILSVDPGPFPEFRLPADRRQYMQDRGQRAQDQPGPGPEDLSGPGDQLGLGPGDQPGPGPGDQPGPGPGDQTLPGAERNPTDMFVADNL